MTEIDLTEAQKVLDGLTEDMEDIEDQYEIERMQEHYENAIRVEYGLEKDSGQYDF